MTAFISKIQQRFSDVDSAGHINNAVLATYIEFGRLEYLGRFPELVDSLILAHLSLDYRRQVHPGQRVEVHTSTERLGRTSVTLRQDIHADGVLCVEGRCVVVRFDYATQQPCELGDTVRAALTAAAA